MDQVSDIEAKERLSALLDDVERGSEVTITRDGRPVARLVPEASPARKQAVPSVQDFARLRADIAARGECFTWDELKEMRDEGRR